MKRRLWLMFFLFTMFVMTGTASAKEIQTGIYGLAVSGNFPQAVQTASQNGFRLTVVNAEKSQLDILKNNGMKGLVAFWLNRETIRDDTKWLQFLVKLRAKVLELKRHPAVFAWYIADEPDGQALPLDKLYEVRNLIRSLDPVTPLFTVFDNPKKWINYLPCFDIIAIDPYMRKNMLGGYESPEVVLDWLKKMKADQKKLKLAKPIWVVLGAFDTRPKAEGVRSNYKKPSPGEFRGMVEMALTEGVDGILVYTFAFTESDRYSGWKLPSDDPLLWHEVRKLPAMISTHK